MKKILLISLITFFTASVFAQVINVPKKSQELFEKEHPDASKIRWKNNVANYTVTYTEKNVDCETHYSIDGDWSYTEKKINNENIPTEAQDTFDKSKYRDWKLKSVMYVEDKDSKSYRYEVKNGIKKMYVYIASDGKVLKEVPTI